MMKPKFWNVIRGNGMATILLYGDVGPDSQVDSERVVSELLSLEQEYGKIEVRINSNGGDVFSGLAIYHALQSSKADLSIYVDGVAASIAAVIALCGKPLYMSAHAQLMIHSVTAGCYGTADELRRTADQIDNLEDELAEMIAGRCGMEPDEVKAQYFADRKDHWLRAVEARAMGLIDGIVSAEADDEATAGLNANELYNYYNNRLADESGSQQKQKDMALFDELKKLPGLKDVSDETQVLERINQLANAATKVQSLETANAELQQKLEAAEAASTQALLNQAVEAGKITKEQLPMYTNLMKSDRATTESLLASMKPKGTNTRLVSDFITSGNDRQGWANKSWDELDRSGQLAALKEANMDLFKGKFKEKFGCEYK